MVQLARNFKTSWKSSFAYVDERVKAHALVDAKLQLPDNFQPSEFSVLCGRGRECYEHSGNRRFREIAAKHAQRYAQAKTKMDKSIIVMDVIDAVRDKATIGGFVKKDPKSGRWIDIGDDAAREKVGQQFRAALGVGSRGNKSKLRKAIMLKQQKDAAVLTTMMNKEEDSTRNGSAATTTTFTCRVSSPTPSIISNNDDQCATTISSISSSYSSIETTTPITFSHNKQVTEQNNTTTTSCRTKFLASAAIIPPAPWNAVSTTAAKSNAMGICATNLQNIAAPNVMVVNDVGQEKPTKRKSVNHNDDLLLEASKLLLEDIPSDEEFFQSFSIHDKATSALIINDFEPVPF